MSAPRGATVDAVTVDARSEHSGGDNRIAAFDVVRSVVLIGVFTMNYVVEWNLGELRRVSWEQIDAPAALRSFMNPWTGPLSTRFAATLSTLVGVGVVLLSSRSIASGDSAAINEDRWRLRRRGLLFVLAGIFFDVVWPGEILHFIGLYLIIAAWAITWSAPTLGLSAVGVAAMTALQRVAVFVSVGGQERQSWWSGFGSDGTRSIGRPRGFLSSVLSWGGHPVLPWMTFVFVGMAIAKLELRSRRLRVILMISGIGGLAAGYAMRFVGQAALSAKWDWVASTEPGGFGRISPFGGGMPAYVVSTVGSSVFFLIGTMWLAERFASVLPIRILARAGKVTFSLYVAHGVIPWLIVSQGWVGQDFGLVRSLAIALASWALAVMFGAAMQRVFGTGPLEWLLRKVSGPAVRSGSGAVTSVPASVRTAGVDR